MGDYIYILILLAWVGFTLYNKSRKARSEGQEKARPQSWLEKSIQEMMTGEVQSNMPKAREIKFEEEPYDDESDYQPPVPAASPVPVTQKQEVTSFEKEYNTLGIYSIEEEDTYRGVEPIQMSYYDLTDQNSSEEDDGDEEDEYRHGFNLRQAVIYAEILNRPYD
jgi:hypothetical protein